MAGSGSKDTSKSAAISKKQTKERNTINALLDLNSVVVKLLINVRF